MRPLTLALLAAVALASEVKAQGFIESSDGTFGAFTLQGGAQLSFNFADKSIRALMTRRQSTSRTIWGGDFKAKASNGALVIFQDSLSSVEWAGDAYYGWVISDPKSSATFVTAVATLGYQYGREAIVDTAPTVARRRQELSGVSGKLAVTWFGATGRTAFLVDAAAAYGPQSNYADLDELDVCTNIAVTGAKSVRSCSPARLASAYRSSRRAGFLFDGVLWPFGTVPIALVGYGRYNTARSQSRFVPALGILFGKSGSPMTFTGSLALEFASATRISAHVGVPLGF